MLRVRTQRILSTLTILVAVACLVYGAQHRITVFNGRPAGQPVSSISKTQPEATQKAKDATSDVAKDELAALDEEFPPLEDLPPLDEGSTCSQGLEKASAQVDAATTATGPVSPDGLTTESQLAARGATPPRAAKAALWHGIAVGDRLPWDPDESKQVEIADLQMIEFGTYGGMHRTDGKLHLTFDIEQGMPAPGKQACPT